MTGEWGLKDGWFSEAGLLAATEDQGKSTEAEKGVGGGLGDDAGLLELDSAELSKTIAAVAGLGGRAGRTVCIP